MCEGGFYNSFPYRISVTNKGCLVEMRNRYFVQRIRIVLLSNNKQ